MLFTLSICTRNRSDSLARTLDSIERSKRPGCPWELLITDNGSTDDTQDVIASFCQRLPIRLQTESRPGVANARNTATAAAKGAYMVCTDDDVIVARDWLEAYEHCFAQWPNADLFAGRITPVLEEPRVEWFAQATRHLGGPLAIREMGDSPAALQANADCVPYGANCAVRTEVQRAFPFDPRRGPGQTYFGEETTSFMAILNAGHVGRWVPQARVEHMISPRRQTEAYIRWWYGSLSRTLVWEGKDTCDGPVLFGAPRWLWRYAVTRELRFRLARMTVAPDIWVDRLVDASLQWGRLRQFRSTPAEGAN